MQGWNDTPPAVGQVAKVWYWCEVVVARWDGRRWVTKEGQYMPGGLWWLKTDVSFWVSKASI